MKIKSCPFCLKNATHGIFEVLIPNPDLDFWNPDLKFCFRANLGQKRQNSSFYLKIDTVVSGRCWFQNYTEIFEIPISRFIFGQIWAERVKNFHFSWKLAYMVSWKKWFENKTLIFKIRVPKLIFGQFWTEKAFPVYSFFFFFLILVLYLRIALQSSATFFRWVWKYELPVFLFEYFCILCM